jgi:hypothetical protein
MRGLPIGNKASGNTYVGKVRNAEASASIPRGTPVILNLSTTASSSGDGMDVVLPATAGNPLSYAARYGIVTDTLAAGVYGESIVFGHASYALITRATRAASSDSWTSSASIASGVALGVDTLNNALLVGASVAGSIATNHIDYLMVDSVASIAASATATSDARTAITASVRVFVRVM